MTSPTVDRRFGLVGNAAFKAPVLVIATSNIVLSGEQTIDSVAVHAVNASSVPDRVLANGQTDATQNGIYDVSTAGWSRSADADGPYDLAQGSAVNVVQGTVYAGTCWTLSTAGPITVGTTALTWTAQASSVVAVNIASVTTVASNIANVETVSGDIANVNIVAADKTNIDLVAADKANLDSVAGNLTPLNIVAANITTIAGVAVAGSYVTALLGAETSAIAISAEEVPTLAMKVIDAANPANNKSGRVTDILSGVFAGPKMTIQSDDKSLAWSQHNLYEKTTNPTASGATITSGQLDSDGKQTAFLLAATNTSYAGLQDGSSVSATGRYYMQEFIVRAGTGAFAHITFYDGTNHSAYFNMSTGAMTAADAGVTAASYATRNDGSALPAGYYRITAYLQLAGAFCNVGMGACDASGSRAVTAGKTIYVEKPFAHFGVLSMDFLENAGTTTALRAPYDYSKGGPRILIEPTSTYNSRYGNDLTNAAWTCTNCTPVFTSTGPDGAPCSKLTATAGNATCLQAVADATASQNFSAFIRRKTGTGAISITTNNGGAWTDITSQLNTSSYVRVQLAAGANPTFGFQIATNADAIEVSYAINTSASFMSSPLPVNGANATRSADSFVVLTSLMTAGTSYTIHADFDRLTGTTYPDDSAVRMGKSDHTQEMRISVVTANGNVNMTATDGTHSKNYVTWQLASNQRLEVTAQLVANQNVMCINGEPPAWITVVGAITMQQVQLAANAPMFLRKLLIVPRAVGRDLVRQWRYSGAQPTSVLDLEVVAWDSDVLIPNTTMDREPCLCVLSDNGLSATALVMWCQRHDVDNTGNAELPSRLMQRTYLVDKVSGTITAATATAVLQQQAEWVNGVGHQQSPNAFVVPSGAQKGRIVCLFTQEDSPDGLLTDDKRQIYVIHNDSMVAGGSFDPAQWSTATLVVSVTTGNYAIVDTAGSGVILPPSHPVAPNRIVTNFYGGNFVKSLYSDDFGSTWSVGNAFFPATQPDESTVSIWPDGTLIMTSRVEAGVSTLLRNWAKSTDGGVNWVDQGTLPAYSYGQCAVGVVQMDPTGALGPYGKTAIAHCQNPAGRTGVQIDFATDAAMTFGSSVVVWPSSGILRYFGYNSLKALFGGSHLLLAVEGGSIPFNVDNTIYLGLVQVTP